MSIPKGQMYFSHDFPRIFTIGFSVVVGSSDVVDISVVVELPVFVPILFRV